jgi:methylmalonyl-CoA/ethylmalonyl-CoA epimerase
VVIPELSEAILDHVAVAVPSIKEALPFWNNLGLSFSDKRESVASQGVTTAFAALDRDAHLELLEPFGEGGPIHAFLAKKGAGIHHLSFRVPDVKKKCVELVALGYTLTFPAPVEGAGGMLVNFIHPKSTGGVLVEIASPKDSY